MTEMLVEPAAFPDPDRRAAFMVDRFATSIQGRVLDVGCDTRRIQKLRPDLDYFGIDLFGEPDMKVDLEATERLPFDDNAFDTVICTDVMEHLDALHRVFDELVRISRGRMLVSLPNCWRNLRKRIARGHGTPQYYGLPIERTGDRHKWFFNTEDVVAFFRAQADRHPMTLSELLVSTKPAPAPLNLARRALKPNLMHHLNRHAHTIWAVYEHDKG